MGTTSEVSSFQPHVSSYSGACGGARRGLWVVLLGPDGAGKSSVIGGVGSGTSAGFTECETFHLRPAVLPRTKAARANTNPHGKTARGTLVTVCKLLYLLAANWLADL